MLFICSMAVMLAYEQVTRVFRLAGSKQLEHTTLPKREQGHKQLGRGHAMAHLAQLVATFVLGAALMSLPPAGPNGARVAMGTFGIVFALQVRAGRRALTARGGLQACTHAMPCRGTRYACRQPGPPATARNTVCLQVPWPQISNPCPRPHPHPPPVHAAWPTLSRLLIY